MPRGAHSPPWLLTASVEGRLSLLLFVGKLGCGSDQGGDPKKKEKKKKTPIFEKLFRFTSLPSSSLRPTSNHLPPNPPLSLTPPPVRDFSRCDRFLRRPGGAERPRRTCTAACPILPP